MTSCAPVCANRGSCSRCRRTGCPIDPSAWRTRPTRTTKTTRRNVVCVHMWPTAPIELQISIVDFYVFFFCIYLFFFGWSVIPTFEELLTALLQLHHELNKHGMTGLASRVALSKQLLSTSNFQQAVTIRSAVLERRQSHKLSPACDNSQVLIKEVRVKP